MTYGFIPDLCKLGAANTDERPDVSKKGDNVPDQKISRWHGVAD